MGCDAGDQDGVPGPRDAERSEAQKAGYFVYWLTRSWNFLTALLVSWATTRRKCTALFEVLAEIAIAAATAATNSTTMARNAAKRRPERERAGARSYPASGAYAPVVGG
jgi:hypothetical protein